jgi:hypothetical protein
MLMMLLMMIRVKNQCPSFLRYYHLLALQFIQIPNKLVVRKVAEHLHSRRFCLAVYQFQIDCTQDVVVYLHLVFSSASANNIVALF